MKTLTTLLILTLFVQQPTIAKVDGEWAVTLALPLGDNWFNMFIVQKGNQLSGYILNDSGQFDLKGSVDRDQVKFAWDYPDGGRMLTVTFTGKVDRNTLSGVAKVGNVSEGTLSAQRK